MIVEIKGGQTKHTACMKWLIDKNIQWRTIEHENFDTIIEASEQYWKSVLEHKELGLAESIDTIGLYSIVNKEDAMHFKLVCG